MEKVTGIGGFFFAARDVPGLVAWYRDMLGIDPVPTDYDITPWTTQAGVTVFTPFPSVENPVDGTSLPFRINFRVDDLDAMIAQLEAAGVKVKRAEEVYPNGRFAWLNDPEGNSIELWEPEG